MSSYCAYAAEHPLHRGYHDEEYGFPQRDDAVLFERLMLEIYQAGLSWGLMLQKRDSLRSAYAGFDPMKVAWFGDRDRERLLADPGVIRNRLKVDAAITNARVVVSFYDGYESFAGWLDAHHPLDLDDWKRLFKQTFKFTGGEIVREFLTSLGYLPDAHAESCPVAARARAARAKAGLLLPRESATSVGTLAPA